MLIGNSPATDEYELSVFGPGYGEAIVAHLGNEEWLLIDSCWHDRVAGLPVSAAYLDSLKVPTVAVKHIVCSHWHDDHSKGMSKLVGKYKQAEFSYPQYFSTDEGSQFLASYSGLSEPDVKGTCELYESLRLLKSMGRCAYPVGSRHIIYESPTNNVLAVAIAPTVAARDRGMASLLSRLPPNSIAERISEPKPNISSVVVHIDLGDEAMLLGADLENHYEMGWPAVVADSWTLHRRKAGIYKVAHHGSETACLDEIWKSLLEQSPVAALTPFIRGNVQLPKQKDISRIKNYAYSLHSTCSPSGKAPHETEAERLLRGVMRDVTAKDKRVGHVRYRKKRGEKKWRVELGPRAIAL